MGEVERIRRHVRFLHSVDPATLTTEQDFADLLEALLHNMCDVIQHGDQLIVVEQRQLVARLDGLRILVYPNDHQPAHFHLVAPGLNARFKIDDCAVISGDVSARDLRKVQYWHSHAKPILVDAWNRSRPTELAAYLEPRA